MNGIGTYRTGFGQRYAMNPDLARLGQTLGHHQWGVATLLLTLFPNCRKDVLAEALLHDTGEPGVGADMASPAKRRYPEIATAVAMAEYVERRRIGTLVEDLTNAEHAMAEHGGQPAAHSRRGDRRGQRGLYVCMYVWTYVCMYVCMCVSG